MKIKKIKLNALSSEVLRQKEMDAIIGGNTCGCSCAYEGAPGGSNFHDNMSANYKLGITSSYGCNQVINRNGYLSVVVQNHA